MGTCTGPKPPLRAVAEGQGCTGGKPRRFDANEAQHTTVTNGFGGAGARDGVQREVSRVGRCRCRCVGHVRSLTASLSAFPALNAGAFEAAMAMLSPVRGLRPWRAARVLAVKLPKPAMETVSPRVSASATAAKTALTTRSAAAPGMEISAATWDDSSALFMLIPPRGAIVHPQRARPRIRVPRRRPARNGRAGGTVPRRRGSAGVAERDVAHDGLELAERRQVLGRAPGDEAGAVGVAPEPDRQGPEEGAREAVEEGEREPGEVGAAGHEEQPGGARPQDGLHARRDGRAEALEERRAPPPPFTTSTLQQEAARRLGFGIGETMDIAQRLYEGVDLGGETAGLITYMRTDSTAMAKSAVAQARATVRRDFGEDCMSARPRLFRTGERQDGGARFAQEAHKAIRPTDFARTAEALEGRLGRAAAALYGLIRKRALASQMAAARFERVGVEIAAEAGALVLAASGTRGRA